MTGEDDTLRALDAQITTVERRLEQIPTFLEWRLLRETRDKLAQIRAAQVSVAPTVAPSVRERVRVFMDSAAQINPQPEKPIRVPIRELILKAGRPLKTREICERLEKIGRNVGGEDKIANLSSILSKDGTFAKIEALGVRGWWPKDEPAPSMYAKGSAGA